MRFDRVSLRNFKCYEDATVSLDRGVTVIHGLNGSGKSSLLEACFFALYGATAVDRTLDEIVTIGAEEAEIDLWFTHEGAEYHLNRRIRATGERATTADCVLDGPQETWDGVGDVEEQIVSMLRMDSEAFVNSAFVRQGEINKLINATPAERQRMIDRLLQLGKLETYRERASEARLGVDSLLDNWNGRLETLENEIEKKEGQDLHEQKATLETELADLEATIERYQENREEAKETLAEAESTLESYEERKAELATVDERIADLRKTIAAAEAERNDLVETIQDKRDQLEGIEDRIADLADDLDIEAPTETAIEEAIADRRDEKESLHEEIMEIRETVQSHQNTAERARERVEDLESQVEAKRERLEELGEEIDSHEETVESLAESVTDLQESIESQKESVAETDVPFGAAADELERLEETRTEVQERETEVREELATARSRVEEAEELLAEGKCPECGQPVEGSPHVESIDEYREAVSDLEAELESVEARKESVEESIEDVQDLRERERTVDSLETELKTTQERLSEHRETKERALERIDELETEIDELEGTAVAAIDTAEQAEEAIAEVRPQIGELNQERAAITERIEQLETLAETVDERADLEREIERLTENRETIAEQNEERREHLQAARERKQNLAETYDEDQIESARERKENAEEYLEKVEEILDEKQGKRDDRQSRLGAVKSEIEALEELRAERDTVAETVLNLESLRGETADLEAMYGDLRAELRQQNVARLERLLNETFDLIYQNDSYARIELSGQYELTVYQKDGEPLEPEQLSGGERALFNLSLRTAIYRLLAEGIDGAAPMPPLILDEPTVFLDSGHVSQLVTLVESMRKLGVEQIIVVSHDDELIGAADDVIRVAKDATTNRSYIEETAMPLDAT